MAVAAVPCQPQARSSIIHDQTRRRRPGPGPGRLATHRLKIGDVLRWRANCLPPQPLLPGARPRLHLSSLSVSVQCAGRSGAARRPPIHHHLQLTSCSHPHRFSPSLPLFYLLPRRRVNVFIAAQRVRRSIHATVTYCDVVVVVSASAADNSIPRRFRFLADE